MNRMQLIAYVTDAVQFGFRFSCPAQNGFRKLAENLTATVSSI